MNADRRLEGVGATALLTAATRALETERPDGVLSDPLARVLAGSEGFELLERGALGPVASNGSPLYVVRHRFFDDILMELTESSGIRQLVLIAAGLDTRAFRLDWPDGTPVLEIDQPSVFAYKDALLEGEDAVPRAERWSYPRISARTGRKHCLRASSIPRVRRPGWRKDSCPSRLCIGCSMTRTDTQPQGRPSRRT